MSKYMRWVFFACFLFSCRGFNPIFLKEKKTYPLSRKYYDNALKRLTQRKHNVVKPFFNNTFLKPLGQEEEDDFDLDLENFFFPKSKKPTQIRILFNQSKNFESFQRNENKKSENFEIVKHTDLTFQDIGGYENIKKELSQCIDILTNYSKYLPYNIRVPRGLILEGPPGNGKTMIAKAFAGESNTSFISVSGSEFQEKYVGVGSSRIRELFRLASKNKPCVIFIDEIDALGRKRSSDVESSSSEKDNTLNELLVALDGFKNNSGIFVIGATNRIDLLDDALLRPGRMDKKIYIGNPDTFTREAIINIHIQGKPHDETISLSNLIDLTLGFSGAQIENLLNEAMLNALLNDREEFTMEDIDMILNKMIAGWQPFEHQFSSNLIDRIAVHEMGHVVMGMLSKYHSKVRKVVINLSSPNTPGYTLFEESASVLFTKETLFEHLAILLSGRIAEEVIYNVSITTGAINDFEEAYKLAEKMVLYYGMGSEYIFPTHSEKYKEMIDNEILYLILEAQKYAEFIISQSKEFILESAALLKKEKILTIETLNLLIYNKYSELLFIN